ncbi:MAG: hypothetical protein Q9165_000213 [Trypethelium subeluteriae]
MSNPYICVSCRQWLRKRAQRLLRAQWRSKADYGPFSRLLTPSSNSTPTANFPLPIQWDAKRDKRDGRQEQQRHGGEKQDDLSWNLEELFAGRMGPGRYSAAFRPTQSDSSAMRDSPAEPESEMEKGGASDLHHAGKPSLVGKADYGLAPNGSFTSNYADPIETATKNGPMDAAQYERVASPHTPALPSSPRELNSHELFDRLLLVTGASKSAIWAYLTENPGVDSMHKMFDQFKPVSASQDWQYLLEHAEDIRKLGAQSQQALIKKITHSIWVAWRKTAKSADVPAPSQVLATFMQNGLPCTGDQLEILVKLHLQMTQAVTLDRPLTAFKYPTILISEIMSMWKTWVKPFASESAFGNPSQGSNTFEWSNLLSALQKQSQKSISKRFHERFFSNLVPHFPHQRDQIRVSAAALLLSILYRRGFLTCYLQPPLAEEIRSFTDFTMELSQGSDVDLVVAWLERTALDLESEETKTTLQRVLRDAGYRSTWPITKPLSSQGHAHRQSSPNEAEEVNVGSYKVSPDGLDVVGDRLEGHYPSESRKKNFHERRASLQGTFRPDSEDPDVALGPSSAKVPMNTSRKPDLARRTANRRLEDRRPREEQLQTKSRQDHNDVHPRRETDGEIIKRRLGRALEQTNLSRVDSLWKSVSQSPPSAGQESSISKSIDVYEAFIFTYMRLGLPNQAIDVWNAMVERGVKPTVTTWTSMMQGCRLERDAESLESLWQRMRDSGVQPDTAAWSTRLYGLIRGGKVREGLAGLQEMGNEQNAAHRRIAANPSKATEADKAVPKPGIEIINAVIIPLSRGPQEQAIQDVLAWAARRGIKPNAFTFNARITIALRQNDLAAAFRLLQEMSVQNVQPDIATFTMLLDNLMRDPAVSSQTPEEQQNLVMTYLTDLERHGLSATPKSYNILLDRLLKHHNNPTAARAVLAHMTSRSLPPNPHLFTILITHYFTRDPPDLAAVDALWAQLQLQPNTHADRVFYDRMVEGYADAGDTGKMMAFLARTTRDRKQPGWWALAKVLRRLAEMGDWERAREVVREARMGEAEAPGRKIGNWGGSARAYFERVVVEVLGGEEGGGREREYGRESLGEEEDESEDAGKNEDAREDVGEDPDSSQTQDESYREAGSGVLDEKRAAFTSLTASR